MTRTLDSNSRRPKDFPDKQVSEVFCAIRELKIVLARISGVALEKLRRQGRIKAESTGKMKDAEHAFARELETLIGKYL